MSERWRDLERAAENMKRISENPHLPYSEREKLARDAREIAEEAKRQCDAYVRYMWLGYCVAFFLIWAAPAHAQMTARCYVDRSGPEVKVQATSTEQVFDVVVRRDRCLLFIRADSRIYRGRRAGWMIDGATGDILAEFWSGSKGGAPWTEEDVGLCSFRGGYFPTSMCTWGEWMGKADQISRGSS